MTNLLFFKNTNRHTRDQFLALLCKYSIVRTTNKGIEPRISDIDFAVRALAKPACHFIQNPLAGNDNLIIN